MDTNRLEKQKSLQRRFLFVLGIVTFICFCCLGGMIIFWDAIIPQMPKTQRWIFGSVIILYAVLRLSRLLRKEKDEES